MTIPTYTQRVVSRPFIMGLKKANIVDLKVSEVVRDDGVVVWASAGYPSGRSATLQAGAARRRLEDYARRTGRCWKADQDAERARVRAIREERRKAFVAIDMVLRGGSDAQAAGVLLDANPHRGCDPADEAAWTAGWLLGVRLPAKPSA